MANIGGSLLYLPTKVSAAKVPGNLSFHNESPDPRQGISLVFLRISPGLHSSYSVYAGSFLPFLHPVSLRYYSPDRLPPLPALHIQSVRNRLSFRRVITENGQSGTLVNTVHTADTLIVIDLTGTVRSRSFGNRTMRTGKGTRDYKQNHTNNLLAQIHVPSRLDPHPVSEVHPIFSPDVAGNRCTLLTTKGNRRNPSRTPSSIIICNAVCRPFSTALVPSPIRIASPAAKQRPPNTSFPFGEQLIIRNQPCTNIDNIDSFDHLSPYPVTGRKFSHRAITAPTIPLCS